MFAKRAYRVMMVIALAALVLPMSSSFSAQAQGKKVLKYIAAGEPATIDPQLGSFVDGVAYDHALFASLLRYDKDNKPQPWMATDIATTANGGISADGKTYTYHLKKWPWSDGKGVVTAQDIVYAWQRVVNPVLAGGYSSFFNGLLLNADTINNTDPAKVDQKLLDTLGVKAVDASTVQFTLVHAAGYWNDIMCLWLGGAVRKDNVERNGPDGKPLDPASGAWLDPANGPIVGSGPFILSKLDHSKEWIFTKNPNYAGTPAKLDEIDLEVIQDAAAAFVGFKSGQLDVSSFPTAELNNIKADPVLGKELLLYPSACSFYLGMDNTKPPFNNIDVRKAFALAFDRDAYTKVISQGLAQKWLSFLPPAIQGADPKLGSAYDFNADEAKAELAKAGFPNGKGFPSVSYHYSAGTNGQRAADWIQAQYKKVLNIIVNEDPMDGAAREAALTDPKNKEDGLYILGWCADYLHPSDWLIPVFGANLPAGNGNNASGFHDANFEKVAAQADNELDPTKALGLYQKAQQILVDDEPVVFLFTSLTALLVNTDKVTNLPKTGLDGGEPGWYFIEDVDVKAS
ncbi:MAG: peptide ABC transporter substrate-binding protein [Aggregatilineales bacterium]